MQGELITGEYDAADKRAEQAKKKIESATNKLGNQFIEYVKVVGPELAAVREGYLRDDRRYHGWLKSVGMNRMQATRIIDCSDVIELLTGRTDLCDRLPSNQDQLLALSTLPEQDVAEVWEKYLDEIGDQRPTAAGLKYFAVRIGSIPPPQPKSKKVLTRSSNKVKQALEIIRQMNQSEMKQFLAKISEGLTEDE